MCPRHVCIAGLICLFGLPGLSARGDGPGGNLSGIVYDHRYRPLPGTHIFNLSNQRGATCGALGIFRIPAAGSDTLLITNVAYRDTLVEAKRIFEKGYILLQRAYHELPVVQIFPWGASYDDFRKAVLEMPAQRALGESLGLPRAKPGHVPYEMDTLLIRSSGFALTSPLSYLYLNFSRKARSARKVYWLEKDRLKHEAFNELTSRENLSAITGLEGGELTSFIAYLEEHMSCDIHCSELAVLSEIFTLYKAYSQ